ncbi:N-acetylmuramoyl-L-alanine amidase [Marilutibacter aestuarii]|uniref:Serine protease n=1 Tax=Marilutibacter aestuarii TaxID=1706195 RepID=A0A508ACQ6_9GAMM|nr:N-acetylmuramoyl-L-alanine amidase [Lysobacter aestuarii]TQD43612.1 hypothetical protein FKV25_10075 [Lysobacter aestuarii]
MALIRANRESIDDRFSVLGFTVRTDLPLFEIGLATDPELLKAENRSHRTTRNFFSSRLLAAGGNGRTMPGGREAVYLVPPAVVARFIGQPRLYFGVATYQDKDRNRPISVKTPDAGHMYVSLSGLTERGLRRTLGGNGQGGNGHALVWGGDALAPATNGAAGRNGAAGGNGHANGSADAQASAPYSDGYSDDLWEQGASGAGPAPGTSGGAANGQASPAINGAAPDANASTPPATAQDWRATPTRAFSATPDDDARHGIEAPIPDDVATARAQSRSPRALAAPAPEYPQADRFVAAHSGNFRATSGARRIERIVIHITDGGANINGTIGWFQNPQARVSAHYVVGQDGEVVQMVRHDDVAWHARSANGTSIGIEHVANTRGLRPTPAQMCASAALVTWLCDRYGIPADRSHVLGHAEADTATTHTGCPNAVWDWDYFMDMVTTRTCHEPGATATTQSLHGRPAVATAQEIIAPFYDPRDPATALQCTRDAFSQAREEWFSGVSDTRQFPHSAICQLIMTAADGRQYQGTGFYIGRNRILTCAHNLHRKARVRIIPGRNGRGAKPFGETTVNASSWRVAPRYTGPGNWDNDLAVIDNVPIDAPHGQFFRFLNASPSAELPVVVCGYSAGSRKVPQLDVIIDGDKQHLHGGYVSEAPTPDTIDYPILSLMGASGSPVYTITGSGRRLEARICAVHVSGEPVDRGLNRGCFITPSKIDWIEGRATSFALDEGSGAAADVSPGRDEAVDPDAIGITMDEPVDATSHAQSWEARALTGEAPDYPGASRFAAAHPRNFTRGRRRDRVLDRIVVHITAGGPNINGTIAWFQNGERVNERTGKPIRSSAHYIVGRDGEVVQMVHDADTAHHASQANSRSIGIEHNANKPGRSNPRDLPPTDAQYEASAGLVAWLCRQHGIAPDREHIRGHHEISPSDNHDCPSSIWDWDRYMECVRQAVAALQVPATTSQGAYATAQEIITPFYDPADPSSALVCQADAFSQAREEWFAGVPNTTIFPHSAICLLEMKDASGRVLGRGTGFYIGARRILTCGHNLHDAGIASVDVVPGKNGQGGGGSEPFGRFNVRRRQWRVPASYRGRNAAFDLAVIDNVPNPAPNGRWFDALEELRQSRPEGVVVCGYSSRSERVPELTAAIDGYKQHLHAGYIAALGAGDSTFDYPIMTLKRASGSPVYYLSDRSGAMKAYVVGVHISSVAAAPDLNRGCRLSDAKIAWIEGRSNALGLAEPQDATPAVEDGAPSDFDVQLVPQPDKNACWAAAMAMLLSHRGRASFAPGDLAAQVGQSLASSHGWELLEAVRGRFGFEAITQPSNTSRYHAPRQWARWLAAHGPLWVVIVGAPHAVVVAGIRGDLDDAGASEVKVLNPWDTRVTFDADPVVFNPPNAGYEDWLSFEDFASAFGNMAEPDYGNWRVLYLPEGATTATAQSLGRGGAIRLAPAPASHALSEDRAPDAGDVDRVEAIEPSRVPGTRMTLRRGSAGASTWALEQLEGMKSPATPAAGDDIEVTEVQVDLSDWPALEGEAPPLPLALRFRAAGGAVGEVRITPVPTVAASDDGPRVVISDTPEGLKDVEARLRQAPADALALDHGVDVMARIEPGEDIDGVAVLKVGIDYRFVGLEAGSPLARIELQLLGDGRHERHNLWVATA